MDEWTWTNNRMDELDEKNTIANRSVMARKGGNTIANRSVMARKGGTTIANRSVMARKDGNVTQ